MKVKAEACLDAIAKGVGRVDICKGIDFLIDPSKKLEGTSFIHS
jgi:acetylglutamate kinase